VAPSGLYARLCHAFLVCIVRPTTAESWEGTVSPWSPLYDAVAAAAGFCACVDDVVPSRD